MDDRLSAWGKQKSFALFTLWVKWHAIAVSLPPFDKILAQIACPRMTSFFVYIMDK